MSGMKQFRLLHLGKYVKQPKLEWMLSQRRYRYIDMDIDTGMGIGIDIDID